MTLVLGVVLGTAFLHAAWNTAAKSVGDRWVSSLLIGVANFVTGLVGVLLFDVPVAACWPFIVASAIAQSCYLLLLTTAYSYGDMSRLYPVARGLSPLIVTVVSVGFLGESLSRPALLGVIIICTAITLLAFARGLPRRGQGVGLALATGAAIATYTLIDGVGVRLSTSALGYASWLFLLQGPLVVAFCWWRGGPHLSNRVRANLLKGLGGGVLSVVAYTIVVWAQVRAPLSLVSALRETSVLWAALAGRVFLHEQLNRKEVAAVVLAALGAATLQITS